MHLDVSIVNKILPSKRDYSITLLDGTAINHHYSDIISALATKSNSDVTLIDPFQIIDWKDQTPPDHLYPKFKVFLDNFKSGSQTLLPAITYMDPQRQEAENGNLNTQTMEQEVQPEACTSEPTQLDSLLQNIIRPDSQLLEKPKSLTSSKRTKNKKATTESKSMKPSYKPQASNRNITDNDTNSTPVDPTPKGK